MKKNKRFFSFLLAIVMCFTMCCSAYAVELPVEDNSNVSQNDDGIMPLSTINGYGEATIKPGTSQFVRVSCTGSGIGGMGITIKTSCSAGTWSNVKFAGEATSSVLGGASIEGTMTTNSTKYFENLYNGAVSEYVVLVQVPAEATSNVYVQVWVYG